MASQYPVNIVTRDGLALISESIATKKNLLFTRIVAGDGTLSDSTDISTMTDVLSPKLELNSTTGVNEGNGQYKIYATISNSKLDVGFFPREVGLYAKVEGGQEVLYSYTNGGNNVGYIPDKTTPIDSEIYKITTVIGNAKNVSLVLKDETFATLLDLNLHNTATDAHANLFNQFLPLAGGTMAGDLNVLNKALTDNSRSAASTKFVRDLLNSYMTKGQTNFASFKTGVGATFEQDFSNPNAWWGKLPNGLIIQGGSSGGDADSNIVLPIQYTQAYKVLATGTATGQGYYTFLTAIKTNLANFKLNTYSGAGQLMAHNFDWITIGR